MTEAAEKPKEGKREKFIRLVEPRVEKALHAIHVISLLGGKNAGNYDFGDSDVDRITNALCEATNKLSERMKRPPRQIKFPFQIDKPNGGDHDHP